MGYVNLAHTTFEKEITAVGERAKPQFRVIEVPQLDVLVKGMDTN